MYEIDMMEGALRSRGNRIMQLEGQLEMQQAAWRDLNSEMSEVIKQRDMLREALDDLINRPFKAGTWPGDAQRDKARAALRECQQGHP